MDEKLINYVYMLKQVIEEHAEVKKLNAIEKELENNPEVVSLQATVIHALEQLSVANEYSYLVEEQKAAHKASHAAKLARDNHPLIQSYLAQYKKVKVLYDLVNKEIFDPFCESDGITCRVK